MNNVIYGNYYTLFYKMDDMKIYHMESTVVDDILIRLEEQYEKVALLNTTREKMQVYLTMVLDLSMKGKEIVIMPKHIHSILETTSTDMDGLTDTPYPNHLFQVQEDGRDMSTQQ